MLERADLSFSQEEAERALLSETFEAKTGNTPTDELMSYFFKLYAYGLTRIPGRPVRILARILGHPARIPHLLLARHRRPAERWRPAPRRRREQQRRLSSS